MPANNIKRIAGHKFTLHNPTINSLSQTLTGHTLDTFALKTMVSATWLFELGDIQRALVVTKNTDRKQNAYFNNDANKGLGSSLDFLFTTVNRIPSDERAILFADKGLFEQEVSGFIEDFCYATSVELTASGAGKIFDVLCYINQYLDQSVTYDVDELLFECATNENGIAIKLFKDLEDYDVIYNAMPIGGTEHNYSSIDFKDGLWLTQKTFGSTAAIRERLNELAALEEGHRKKCTEGRATYLNLEERVKQHNKLMQDYDKELIAKRDNANIALQALITAYSNHKKYEVALLKKQIARGVVAQQIRQERMVLEEEFRAILVEKALILEQKINLENQLGIEHEDWCNTKPEPEWELGL